MKSSNSHTQPPAVWDRSVRVFHWLNLACFLCLVALGTALLNGKVLGLTNEGKILLKQLHIWIGYVFVLNMTWRVLWGFIGSPTARWHNILPFSRKFAGQLKADIEARRSGRLLQYSGHNPLGRLMVTALMALLLVQAGTGLILAATDMYQGPLGQVVASTVAAEGVDPASLKPYDQSGVNPERYEEMRGWRKPVVETHEWVFFILLGLVLIHIAAVVIAELQEGSGLVSAMITGRKQAHDERINTP